MERFLDMHMYITSALQKTDMKAVGLQLALDLLHKKVWTRALFTFARIQYYEQCNSLCTQVHAVNFNPITIGSIRLHQM